MARLLQTTDRSRLDRVRGRARRGPVLWLGRQSRQALGRPAICTQVHAPETGEPLVDQEPAALCGAQSQREIETARDRAAPDGPRLWSATGASIDAGEASRLHPRRVGRAPGGIAPLRCASARGAPAVFRPDRVRQTGGNETAALEGGDPPPVRRQGAGTEVENRSMRLAPEGRRSGLERAGLERAGLDARRGGGLLPPPAPGAPPLPGRRERYQAGQGLAAHGDVIELPHMTSPLGLESGVVRLVEYDARWPALYEAEADRLLAAVAPLPLVLEHTGSTAVPGLSAKPVLDILAGYRDPGLLAEYIARLTAAGYVHRGEQDIPGREFFRRGHPRAYHLHLTREGSGFW